MLAADGCDLGVERQVASDFGGLTRITEVSRESRSGQQETSARTFQQAVHEIEGDGESTWWMENSKVGNNPGELGQAEHGESPDSIPFGKFGQSFESAVVMASFASVRVDQDICINGNHLRSMRS